MLAILKEKSCKVPVGTAECLAPGLVSVKRIALIAAAFNLWHMVL
jgi:hypothetical protein